MREDWNTKYLEEIAEIGDGNHSGKYPKSSEMVTQGIPFIRGTNLIDGKVSPDDMRFISPEKHVLLKKGHLKTGDILFTNRGQIGKMAIVDERFNDSNLNSQVAWFRCNERINNRYLYYYLDSPFVQKFITSNTNGTALQQLTIRQIRKFEIPFPSLSEQKQIVEILDEAFVAIDQAKTNIEKNIQNAKELFQSKLNEIFNQKGNGWEEKKLGDICENIDSKRVPITKSKRIPGQIPYYGASGIVDYVADYLFDEDLLLVSEDGANLLARTYPIAFSISGKTWVNNHAHTLRFKNMISQIFVEYYLNSIKLDDFISGMAQPKLNQAKLNSIPIPFPSIDIQEKTTLVLNALNENIKLTVQTYKLKISSLEELKKSILQKAFAGELTKKMVEV